MTRSEARQQAWATRREKYGPRGHSGSYAFRPAVGAYRLLAELMNEGILSEGQVANATGLDRVAVRKLADDVRDVRDGYEAALSGEVSSKARASQPAAEMGEGE